MAYRTALSSDRRHAPAPHPGGQVRCCTNLRRGYASSNDSLSYSLMLWGHLVPQSWLNPAALRGPRGPRLTRSRPAGVQQDPRGRGLRHCVTGCMQGDTNWGNWTLWCDSHATACYGCDGQLAGWAPVMWRRQSPRPEAGLAKARGRRCRGVFWRVGRSAPPADLCTRWADVGHRRALTCGVTTHSVSKAA
jgi:hypothetical protein